MSGEFEPFGEPSAVVWLHYALLSTLPVIVVVFLVYLFWRMVRALEAIAAAIRNRDGQG